MLARNRFQRIIHSHPPCAAITSVMPKRNKKDAARSRAVRGCGWIAPSAAAIALSAIVMLWRPWQLAVDEPTLRPSQQPSAKVWQLELNGGGEVKPLAASTWRHQLHERFPHAQQIRLYDDAGHEVLKSVAGDDHRSSQMMAVATVPSGARLFAVTDHFPFVWPVSPVSRQVDLGPEDDDAPSGRQRVVELRVASDSPRVLVAHGVLSLAECDALRAAARPLLEESVTFVGGRQLGQAAVADRAQQPRSSSTAWLNATVMASIEDETATLVRSAQRRLSALSRLPLAHAENMQVLRYSVGDHYHYHLDNGGSSAIAGRVLTALVYLNDDFGGGETNWPMAGTDVGGLNVRHVYRVREHFANCQVAQGLTLQPRRGSVALFYSLQPNSDEKDWMAWHASCDVTNGVKWAANFWWHLGMMRPRQCTDAEPACQAWAASGECQNNRAFMHRQCRRACGLCTN